MELKDTIELMNSKDYKERFKAEYFQLKIRYEKLQKFIDKIDAYIMLSIVDKSLTTEPVHDCPNEMLKGQLNAMGEYLRFLRLRANIEKIDLYK